MSHVDNVHELYFHDVTVSDALYGRMVEEAQERDELEALEQLEQLEQDEKLVRPRELYPDPLAGIANVRAELVARRQELVDRLSPRDELGAIEPRVLFVVAGLLAAGFALYLFLPYAIGAGAIYAAVRHLTRGTRRRRPKSSWSSLGRTAALMFAAWNSRWLKPANVQRGGRPLRVSVPASVDGEPNPLDELA